MHSLSCGEKPKGLGKIAALNLIQHHEHRQQIYWLQSIQLWLGRVPRILPPLTLTTGLTEPSDLSATEVIWKIHTDTLEAKDNLNRAKISQAIQSNKTRTLTFPFKIGDHVQLSTLHRRHKFKGSGECPIAKFMPGFDRPFKIIGTNEAMSTVKLELPPNSKMHPVFHTSLVLPFKENDPNLFPRCKFAKPQLIINETSNQGYFVKDIINEHRSGCGFKYLVQWVGYGEEENRWLARKELEDTKALNIWLARGMLEPT